MPVSGVRRKGEDGGSAHVTPAAGPRSGRGFLESTACLVPCSGFLHPALGIQHCAGHMGNKEA